MCRRCRKPIPDSLPPRDRTFVFGKRNQVLGEACPACAAKVLKAGDLVMTARDVPVVRSRSDVGGAPVSVMNKAGTTKGQHMETKPITPRDARPITGEQLRQMKNLVRLINGELRGHHWISTPKYSFAIEDAEVREAVRHEFANAGWFVIIKSISLVFQRDHCSGWAANNGA